MTKFLARFAADRSGATAIEYALLVTLLGVALCGALLLISGRINITMGTITTTLGG